MHQPTLRVLQVLEHVSVDGSGTRLADLSRDLGIPKSTLVPILQTLCQKQYLLQDDFGRYSAGTALFCLGAAFSGHFPVLRYVHQQLEELVEQLGETCYFGVLSEGQVLYLDKADSPQPIRMLTSVGRRLPAYATGIGKALLSELPEETVRSFYPDGLQPLTEQTITEFPKLLEQLRIARQKGFAWEVEESTPHVRCFAVPIRKFGAVVAAISVSIPLFRYDDSLRRRIVQAMQLVGEQMRQTFEQTDAHFADIF